MNDLRPFVLTDRLAMLAKIDPRIPLNRKDPCIPDHCIPVYSCICECYNWCFRVDRNLLDEMDGSAQCVEYRPKLLESHHIFELRQ